MPATSQLVRLRKSEARNGPAVKTMKPISQGLMNAQPIRSIRVNRARRRGATPAAVDANGRALKLRDTPLSQVLLRLLRDDELERLLGVAEVDDLVRLLVGVAQRVLELLLVEVDQVELVVDEAAGRVHAGVVEVEAVRTAVDVLDERLEVLALGVDGLVGLPGPLVRWHEQLLLGGRVLEAVAREQ